MDLDAEIPPFVDGNGGWLSFGETAYSFNFDVIHDAGSTQRP
jgi:hypothetical protein